MIVVLDVHFEFGDQHGEESYHVLHDLACFLEGVFVLAVDGLQHWFFCDFIDDVVEVAHVFFLDGFAELEESAGLLHVRNFSVVADVGLYLVHDFVDGLGEAP
jgi:hypothetical protein